jgi:DNA-binding response OmpR family regulator
MKEEYSILIVDEEDSTIEAIKEFLEAEGNGVDVVSKGRKALESVWQKKYHLVLIHIELPDMDGIELLKEIRDYDSLAQIIMLSSDSNMSKIIAALEYGANDYIHKPMSQEYVIEVINYSLQKLERWRSAMIHLIQ